MKIPGISFPVGVHFTCILAELVVAFQIAIVIDAI